MLHYLLFHFNSHRRNVIIYKFTKLVEDAKNLLNGSRKRQHHYFSNIIPGILAWSLFTNIQVR